MQHNTRFLSGLLSAVLIVFTTGHVALASEPTPSRFAHDMEQITVQFSEGTNMAVAVAPGGEQLVLAIQGSLWLLPSTGGEAQQLTFPPVEASRPSWSPDGSRIAFQRFDGHYYQIWTVGVDGNDMRAVTTGPYDHREPAWHGPRIAFSSDRSGEGHYDIWSMRLDDGHYRRWTRYDTDAHSPAWSPDGRRLAYVAGNRILSHDGWGEPRLEVIGGGPALHAPAWRPDGSGLVYQDAERQLRLGSRQLTSGEDVFPFPVGWSGKDSFYYTADGMIRHHDLSGSDTTQLSFSARMTVPRPQPQQREVDLVDTGPSPARGIFSPVFSPDGEQIAFVALNDLWLTSLDGGLQRLTQDHHVVWTVSWASDGERLYFSSDRHGDGRPDFYAMDVDSWTMERVAETPDSRMIFPVIAPDGERFAYIDGEDHSLWVHDLRSGEARRIVGQAYGSNVGRPSWSPDGRYIALADIERANSRFREGRNLIRVVEVTSGDWQFHEPAALPAQLSERLEAGPAWSPDGRWMAFIMASTLHLLPVDESGSPSGPARPLTHHAADLPSWSADSRQVLYVSNGTLRSIDIETLALRHYGPGLEWQRDVPTGRLHILAGALWDGLQEEPQQNRLVVVENGRIREIREAGSDPRRDAQEQGAEFLDGSDYTLMPGLWDGHIHPRVQDFTGQWWAVHLAFGITTVLSNGASIYHTMMQHEAIEAGNLHGPRLLTSPLYDGQRPFYGHHRVVPDEQVLALELDKARALDMDYLKAYVRAPVEYMEAVAAAAQDMGLPNGSHFLSPGIQSGMGGTTHLSASQRMSYSWAESAAGHSYGDVLNLYSQAGFDLASHHSRFNNILGDDPGLRDDPRLQRLMPPNYLPQLNRELSAPPTDDQREAIMRSIATPLAIREAGGLVTIGSDSPLAWPALGLHAQLRAFNHGLSNHEALQSVTIDAARYALLDQELGSVEVGKVADLVLVRGNPLDDIRRAADVAYVIKGGRVRTVTELLELFPEAGK